MCADPIHHGHINIIKKAKSYGYLIIGLLSDAAIETYKKPPILSFEHRKTVIQAIRDVDLVVAQNTLSYKTNLKIFQPDIVIHADDWRHGVQQLTRNEVITILSQWNGRLIEIPYTKGISSTKIRESL